MKREERRRFGRSHWAAIGAAIAVTFGAGGIVRFASADSAQSGYVAITPCRLVDTRAASTVGPKATPIGSQQSYSVQVTGTNGNCTIPATAVGVQMNVVAINPTLDSYLTVYPSDALSVPLASNLNWVAGQAPVPNAVTGTLSATGKISFFNNAGQVDIAADIMGYFTPGAGAQGPPGPKGDPGVAQVYARVNADGTLDTFAGSSKNLVAANISHTATTGIYCFGGLTVNGVAFKPLSIMVLNDSANALNTSNQIAAAAVERGLGLNFCPVGFTDARVSMTQVDQTNAPTLTDHGFFVWMQG